MGEWVCGQCGQTLTRSRVPVVSATADDWHVELLDYPALACAAGHEHREPYADFNTVWHDRLCDIVGLYRRRRGLLNRRYECRKCGEELREPAVETIEVEVHTRPGDEFRVRATGPIIRCKCGELTIRDRESDSFSDALIAALDGKGFARY